MNASDFLEKGDHGINLSENPDHFIMTFDLTSTQEASHDFIHPELTNCSIAEDLQFSVNLTNNTDTKHKPPFDASKKLIFYLKKVSI